MDKTDSSNESSSDDDIVDLAMISYLLDSGGGFIDRLPCRTSALRGKEYINEILTGNPTRCYEGYRMKPHVFRNLCHRLRLMELLKDSRDVSVEEGVAMALVVLCHGTTQRVVAERYQHSIATVHAWFKVVLRAFAALATTLIVPINRGEVQPEILNDARWYPYFKKCIGAIDGTHVAAWAPAAKQKTFRGRKAVLVTQNVMVACSHDMMFTFVYAGWEGTANDSRVFLDALTRSENRFPFPNNDCYYVVDSGYPNIPGFLAPYRGEKYHPNEFRGRRIRGKYEFFNYRHSSLRGVVERTFGTLKKRFHILQSIPSYPLRRQKLIPIACCALHNFIRQEDRADDYFTRYGREGLDISNEVDTINVIREGISVDMSQQQRMSEIREAIAEELWANHIRSD